MAVGTEEWKMSWRVMRCTSGQSSSSPESQCWGTWGEESGWLRRGQGSNQSEGSQHRYQHGGAMSFALEVTRRLHVPVINPGAVHQAGAGGGKKRSVGMLSCHIAVMGVGKTIKS